MPLKMRSEWLKRLDQPLKEVILEGVRGLDDRLNEEDLPLHALSSLV